MFIILNVNIMEIVLGNCLNLSMSTIPNVKPILLNSKRALHSQGAEHFWIISPQLGSSPAHRLRSNTLNLLCALRDLRWSGFLRSSGTLCLHRHGLTLLWLHVTRRWIPVHSGICVTFLNRVCIFYILLIMLHFLCALPSAGVPASFSVVFSCFCSNTL